MGKFDGYLICTDLDGTFCLGHELCGENAKYVKYFQENGGLFTVSTGRLPNHLDAFPTLPPTVPQSPTTVRQYMTPPLEKCCTRGLFPPIGRRLPST